MMVSSRQFDKVDNSLDRLLNIYRPYETETLKIKTVFGYCGEPIRMFGGRPPKKGILTWDDVATLNKQGIAFSATLSNHYLDDAALAESFKFIEKLLSSSEQNSIITVNRTFTKKVKAEFPKILTKQSAISDSRTLAAIERALEIYDLVTLSHNMLDEREFLINLPKEIKNRLVLFASGGCAYKCFEKTCYVGNSQEHFGLPVTQFCTGRNNVIWGKGTEEVWPKPYQAPFVLFDTSDEIFNDVNYIKYAEIPLTAGGQQEVS